MQIHRIHQTLENPKNFLLNVNFSSSPLFDCYYYNFISVVWICAIWSLFGALLVYSFNEIFYFVFIFNFKIISVNRVHGFIIFFPDLSPMFILYWFNVYYITNLYICTYTKVCKYLSTKVSSIYFVVNVTWLIEQYQQWPIIFINTISYYQCCI